MGLPQVAGDHQVEMAAATVLEQRDRVAVARLASRVGALAELVEVGAHVVRGDHAGGDRDHEITALGERGETRVDEDLGASHDLVVDLTVVR